MRFSFQLVLGLLNKLTKSLNAPGTPAGDCPAVVS